MTRRQDLQTELDGYVAKLAEDPRCQRIILFGSLAADTEDDLCEASYIDLIVIQETELPFWKRMQEMRRHLDPHVATDLFVYTPDEFEQLLAERPYFQDEVMAKGRVVYERP